MIPNEVYAQTLLGFLKPVQCYLDDPAVSEIIINGTERVYVERHGRLTATDAHFGSSEAILCIVRNAAQFVGKDVDELNPILEARLPDGSRLQAIIPPAAPRGPQVSIRRFSRTLLDIESLIEGGTLTRCAAETLSVLVRARLNLLIAGGTGSGKTSLLNVLAGLAPTDERIVVIEDSNEIEIPHPHVVHLESRAPDPDGLGAVSIRDLFRATLRMRPDRIVIGEVRGGEALDIIQAMVSGHGGCMGTLHATYPRDTLTRLETMAMMTDVPMPLTALRLQIASGVNIIVQISRTREGRREVTHISEVLRFDTENHCYEVRDLFVREYSSLAPDGGVLSELLPTGVLPASIQVLRQHGLDLPDAVHDAARKRGVQ